MRYDPGVYAIYYGSNLVYIGSSRHVQRRIAEHSVILTQQGIFADFIIRGNPNHRVKIKVSYSKKYGEWLMREARLLKRLKPLFNLKGTGKSREQQYCFNKAIL